MDEKRKIAENFEDNEDLKHLSELILLDEYGEEAFTEKDYKRINKTYLKKIIKMIKRIRGTDDGKDALQKLLKEANTMIVFLEESNCKKAKDILNDASDEINDIELEIKANIDEK